MAQSAAPNRPSPSDPFVGRDGRLTDRGLAVIDQMWRQVVGGFVTVPCVASGKNIITLTPRLHKEGASDLSDGMVFSFEGDETSDGAVTIILGTHTARKAYVTNGSAQANAGDVVGGSIYEATYWSSLDSAAGGFVIR